MAKTKEMYLDELSAYTDKLSAYEELSRYVDEVEEIRKEIAKRDSDMISSIATPSIPSPWSYDDYSTTVKSSTSTVDKLRLKNLMISYLLQAQIKIDPYMIEMIEEVSFKERVKKDLMDSMFKTVKKKATFTQIKDTNENTLVKAKVYVFSEKEMLEFIDKIINL